jgi:hypothetical protein
MYFYLIYTSLASRLMPETDLNSLLEQSRRNNIKAGITGLLLYMEPLTLGRPEGRFIQMLEGPEAAVRTMFDAILADDRHRGLLRLSSGYAAQRQFEDWSMGFRSFDAQETDNAGFKELSGQLFKGEPFLHPADPVKYLKSFYTINQP